MPDATEILESQERVIKKQAREIKKLEREITSLRDELLNTKKEQKLKLLEIQKRIKEQSATIKNLRQQTKLEARTLEEMSLKQLAKEEDAFSKIETLNIEREELVNKISQKDVIILEKENEISSLNTEVKGLRSQIEHIKHSELDELRNRLKVKEGLIEQQNDAVNKLTLDIKKYEVEIAELEYKLSNEQAKNAELMGSQEKVEKQEELIIHLRSKNISNEEKIKELREQLNNSNKRVNDLLEKVKALQNRSEPSEVKIPFYQINLPE